MAIASIPYNIYWTINFAIVLLILFGVMYFFFNPERKYYTEKIKEEKIILANLRKKFKRKKNI